VGLVAKQATPLDTGWPSADSWLAIASALVAQGVDPRATSLLVAEVQLENGRSLTALWNHNVGNVKLSPSRTIGRDYYQVTDRTGSTDFYESFSSLEAGMSSYVFEMVTRRPTAYAAAVNGDLEGYARTLYYGESGTGNDGYIAPPYVLDNGVKVWDVDECVRLTGNDLRQLVSEGRDFYQNALDSNAFAKVAAMSAFKLAMLFVATLVVVALLKG